MPSPKQRNNKKKGQQKLTAKSDPDSLTSSSSSPSGILEFLAAPPSSRSQSIESSQATHAVQEYVSNMYPEEVAGFVKTSTAAAPVIGRNAQRWPRIRKSLNVPWNGVGRRIDLVDITSRVWPDPVTFRNRMNVIYDHPAMLTIPEQIKMGRTERGKAGMVCENPDCKEMMPDNRELSHCLATRVEDTVLKRCQGCMQVSYCSRDCQLAHWKSHKAFCKVLSESPNLRKDGFARLIHTLLANPCLTVLLKSYARDAHDYDHHPERGILQNIVFTCTVTEENRGDAPPGYQEQLMLQIISVNIIPYDADSMKDERTPHIDAELARYAEEQLERAEIDAQLREDVRLTQLKMGTPEERKEAYRRMFMLDVGTIMTFKSDFEGASSTVFAVEKIPRALMVKLLKMPEPVIWLLQLNQTIREDIENKFGLRMPIPRFPSS